MERLILKNILKDSIFFKDKLLDISQYEIKNIEIFEQTFKNKSKINLLITPDRESIEILLLIVWTIKLYIKNLNDKNNDILDYLNVGDIVVYKGKKLEYLGICKSYDEKKIKLKQRGNRINGIRMNDSINYIRVSDYYELSIYKGSSKKLSTMSNNKSKKKSGKYILADMLDVDLKSLSSIVKQQMIIVYPNKYELEDLLNNIKIKVNDKKYYFTEIFPSKYYSSIDSYINYKGNKLGLKEVLIFTSKLSLATELIQQNENICNLLLLGEGTYADEIGGELDSLLIKKKLKKVYILNTFDKCMELQQLIESMFSIELRAWTKSVFLQNSNKIYLKNRRIYLFLNRSVSNKLIDICIDVPKKIFALRVKLLDLRQEDFYCNNKEIFLKISYGLLKIFEKIIIPIKEYDEFIVSNKLNKYPVYKLVEELAYILKENKFYDDNYKILENIVELVKELNELLYYKNPKYLYLENIDLGYGDAIFCSNFVEKSILENYKFIQDKCIVVDCIKSYRFSMNFRKIIFTGVYRIKNIDQICCFNGLDIINLLYPSEVGRYNAKVNRFNKLSKLIEENNKLGSSNNVDKLQKVKVDYNKFIEDNIVDDIKEMEMEVEKNIYNNVNNVTYENVFENDLDIEELLNISIDQNASSTYLEYDNGYVKKQIKFKDRKGALLTPFYQCKCLNHEDNNIVKKGINSLEIGDKLIFIYDRTEDEITELFYTIMCSYKFKRKYNKDYYNMKYWKKVLKKYIDNYFQEYSLVVTELALHGINRSEQAVKSWILYKNIIGPKEKEVYKALADITKDNYFLENWEEIYESCTLIRNLKTKLKDNFNYMVIKSVINQRTEGAFENLVYDELGDLKQYAQIEEIKEISDISINIPVSKTNCILKEEIIYEFLR